VSDIKLSLIPVGKIDPEELDIVAGRVAKVLRGPVEICEALPIPRGTEDTGRGQHRADAFHAAMRRAAVSAAPDRAVGSAEDSTPSHAAGMAKVVVTDVDLFTPSTEGVFGTLDPASHFGVVSVRRLREAFWRRKANPKKQKARIQKELLRAAGRLRGLPDCPDPACALSPTDALSDIDRKAERLCRNCAQRIV